MATRTVDAKCSMVVTTRSKLQVTLDDKGQITEVLEVLDIGDILDMDDVEIIDVNSVIN